MYCESTPRKQQYTLFVNVDTFDTPRNLGTRLNFKIECGPMSSNQKHIHHIACPGQIQNKSLDDARDGALGQLCSHKVCTT